MEELTMLILGIVLSVVGIINMTGNISTIHSYNRRKVREEDIPKYGKWVGLGTLIIGLAFSAGYFLQLAGYPEEMGWVNAAAIVIGLGLILYAQFKYNKGIF